MRTRLLTTLLTLAALRAAADTGSFTSVVGDPLTKHIMSGLAQGKGEITGSSRGASGQTIPIKIVDPLLASVAAAPLRDAAADANALGGLKPAPNLTVKASTKRTNVKDPRAAKKQLKKIEAEKQWSGRKQL